MKYCILFVFATFSCLALELNFSLQIQEKPEPVVLHNRNGTTVTLAGAKLFYKDENGDTGPTFDGYFVEVINTNYPIIVDMLKGPVVSLRLADVDENKGDEMLVFYIAGTHQYGVNIYTVDGTEVTPLKTQPVSSNMHSVEVKGKDIIVKNEEIGDDGKRFLSTATYNVVHGDCKLVREEKSAEWPITKPNTATTNAPSSKQ
jgi:hypothetical protein